MIMLMIIMSQTIYTHASPYAINVVDYEGNALPPFNDPTEALGSPDYSQNVPSNGFYSIGQFGWISLELGQPVLDIPGNDILIWEEEGGITDESADVFLSFDSQNWTLVGTVLAGVVDSSFIDIQGSGMEGATYIKVVDITGAGGEIAAKGFDLDAVEILSEPATMSLILIGGMMLRSRRNKNNE